MLDLSKMIRDEANAYVQATQSMSDSDLAAHHRAIIDESDVIFVCLADETLPDGFRYTAIRGNDVLANVTCGTAEGSVRISAVWATNPKQFQNLAFELGDESLASMLARNSPDLPDGAAAVDNPNN